MQQNSPPTGREAICPDHCCLITTTDRNGRITYANDDFMTLSGYSRDKLIGRSHNLIRHPDMPSALFRELWRTIQKGHSWRGLVKNHCRNGDHYWVDICITPVRCNGEILEYQSVGTSPDPQAVARAEHVYRVWQRGHHPWLLRLPAHSSTTRINAALLVPFTLLLAVAPGTAGSMLIPAALAYTTAAALVALFMRPFQKLRDEALTVADDPVMTWIYTGRNDCAGRVRYALGVRRSEFYALSARLHETADHLQSTSNRLVEEVRDSSQTMHHRREATDTLHEAVNHLSRHIKHVASVTQGADSMAREAREQVNRDRERMASMRDRARAMVSGLAQAKDSVHGLSERNRDIGLMLDVINDIAEQTNLLALNAAIEASRAGENGQGFAVVADQVRALAQRTHDSTSRISGLIEGLRTDTGKAAKVIEEGISCARDAIDESECVHEAMAATLEQVECTADQTGEAIKATREQTAFSGQVADQSHQLRALDEQHSRHWDETMNQVTDLSKQMATGHALTGHILGILRNQAPEVSDATQPNKHLSDMLEQAGDHGNG